MEFPLSSSPPSRRTTRGWCPPRTGSIRPSSKAADAPRPRRATAAHGQHDRPSQPAWLAARQTLARTPQRLDHRDVHGLRGAREPAGTSAGDRVAMTRCLVCGARTSGSRCPAHRLPPRGRRHRRVRAQVLAEETTCWICGEPARHDDPLTLDHLVPRAHGGPTTRANARAAHRSCNVSRGIGS